MTNLVAYDNIHLFFSPSLWVINLGTEHGSSLFSAKGLHKAEVKVAALLDSDWKDLVENSLPGFLQNYFHVVVVLGVLLTHY